MARQIFEAVHLLEPGDGTVLAEGKPSADLIDPVFRAPLLLVREQSPTYQKTSRQPTSTGQTVDCADLCERLLRDVRAKCQSEQALNTFLSWATARFDWPSLLHVLASHQAWRMADRTAAFKHAEKALSVDPLDLYAQRLLSWARDETGEVEAELESWLKDRFCPRPFEAIETRPNGDVNTCCDAWMPAAIGNIGDKIDTIWNSKAAQEIRRSILDGDFRYCSRVFCPKIVERTLPHRDEVRDAAYRTIMRERRTVVERRPRRVLLSHDRSCNLACPSCRQTKIVANKKEQAKLKTIADEVLLPLLRDTHIVKVTGSGDPFGSHHFRYILKKLDRNVFPDLRLEIQTNGQLLDKKAWDNLGLDGMVDSIWISIDAAHETTYQKLRAGGSFGRLLDNLAFVGELRAAGKMRMFRLDTVVQKENYLELSKIVDIGRRIGADIISFQRIRNWGTFTTSAFSEHDVAAPDHPEHAAFLRVLASPDLGQDDIELGNLRALRNQAIAKQPGLSAPRRPVLTNGRTNQLGPVLDEAYTKARSGDRDATLSALRSVVLADRRRRPPDGHVLLVHMGRCGSTVLADLLGQRPDMTWDTELFTAERGLWHAGDNPFAVLWRQMADRTAPYYGFELKTWQPEELGIKFELLLECLELLGVTRFVLLERDNLIHRTISSDVGSETGRWHLIDHLIDGEPREIPKMRVKLENPHFVSRLRAQDRLWQETLAAFGDRRTLRLSYEKNIMVDPVAAYRRVCQFHNLRSFEDVQIRYARTTPFELVDMIENFEDLAHSLKGTGYEWMLDTTHQQ